MKDPRCVFLLPLDLLTHTRACLHIGWAGGNANCDDVVNATDLAILKASFGFEAPTGAVPEPATLGLLALGGLALLKRRKS